MIDTHVHLDTRPMEDFELMAIAGITDVITLAHDPLRMSSDVVFRDHFDRLEEEKKRAGKQGIRVHLGLGLHPRTRPEDIDACEELLEGYLKRGCATAIGETGLETRDPFEVRLFQVQIELAKKYDLPIIAHTPRSSKVQITREIINVLSTFSIDPDRIVIDHADPDTVKLIIDRGYNAGLTVQPGKLSPAAAAEIVKNYDVSRLILNTDMSSNLTDVLGVPRTAHVMRLAGIDPVAIDAVCDKNARRVFKIKP
ncbi:TatD family hydrolase [Methanocella sp. MCL-LM]|uniref:TatD family hydrolase n=1 Tax=Methanocella sp. MCL-LM TaxID=3412035 RepID=UPI003C78D146